MDASRHEMLIALLQNPIFNISPTNDESLEIYSSAFTHKSYAKEQSDIGESLDDYERLEFLGNFVLGLVVSEYLFKEFDLSEGEMTKRMEVVSDANLAEMIKRTNLGFDRGLILRGKRAVGTGKKIEDSIIACAFEALIGAIYLDQGLKKTREVIINLMASEIADFEFGGNYIGMLQEYVQKDKLGELVYVEKRLTGPDHKPTFKAIVKIDNKNYGAGVGKSKKAAKMMAAKSALDKLVNLKK